MSGQRMPAANETRYLSTLQMMRAEVQLRDFQRWMGIRRLQDPDHATHSLLTECFGDLAPKPFRLITPRHGTKGVLYGYGTANSTALREQTRICADPLQIRVIPADRIDTKPMPTAWRSGQRIGFETRIRPVVRQSRRGANPKAGERDVFVVEADQHPPDGMNRSRETVYTDWLGNQLERLGGARLNPEQTKLVSFRRKHAIYQLRGPSSEGPEAIMRGVITITHSDSFAQLLARGVGRHRAYGYGMLLLRPQRRR